MSKPRFQFTYGNVSIFADRLRLSSYTLFDRFHFALAPDADVEKEQEAVSIDLPNQDAAAYRRAAAAFNAIMDEHERTIAARNARRRERAALKRAKHDAPSPSTNRLPRAAKRDGRAAQGPDCRRDPAPAVPAALTLTRH